MAYAPYHREPTVCRDCGAVIGFVQNRDGSWFPVDIVCNPREPYGDYYRTGMGNHGNFTPWHKCSPFNMPAEDSAAVAGHVMTRYTAYNEILRDAVAVPDEVRARVHTFFNSPKYWTERVMARRLMSTRDLTRMIVEAGRASREIDDDLEAEAEASGIAL